MVEAQTSNRGAVNSRKIVTVTWGGRTVSNLLTKTRWNCCLANLLPRTSKEVEGSFLRW
jgi:hypothetical protein